MKRKIRFDDSLPTFESSSFFCSLDKDIEEGLATFPETAIRASVGLRFLQRAGGNAEHLGVTESEEGMMQSGYIRAALMELVGMQDAIAIDLKRLGSKAKPLTIPETENPMLVVLRELRNVHVHTRFTRLDSREQDAVIRSASKEIETTVTVRTIPRTELDALLTRRELLGYYDAANLREAIEWFDRAQNRWGIIDVVLHAFNAYAAEILRAHSQSQKDSTNESSALSS